ncbi:MAG TPA: Stk1 family PASTA domain-containing Ser/Thr kinase [Candidatus Limnocylindrales bacterium]|nr:Stk1 family PASTA domain-containing Ser/Thr kinase [Candidatus Limnocylindrales bacterium]
MSTQVADPLLGALVDQRYRVRGRVAKGGMATVYTALDERLDRTVALKIIHPSQSNDASFVDRFTDEAKTVARLTHPNVVAVYDQGTHSGLPYLVMEYVRGRTLRDILAERRRLTPAEALAVMEQVLSALAAAHRAGLVHRDVKPENVLVAEAPSGNSLVDAVVKVADFGLARAVEASAEDPEAGHLMATVAYVAPELVADGFADPRSDVYSAGVMLFEMLTGRVPYDGDRPVDVAWQHVDRDVPPPSRYAAALPPSIDELVLSATRRDPGARPTDAGALLAQVQAGREGLASGNAVTQRMQPIAQRTMVVDQARPAWARLPASAPPRPRTRRKQSTVVDQLRDIHGQITSTRSGRQALGAGLIGMLVLLLMGGWWFGFGRYDAAPELLSLTRDQAVSKAQLAGLQVSFADGIYREDVAKDVVLNQVPGPGERIVKGGTITLTLSKGPERYQVPNVVGKSKDAATTELQGEPLRLKIAAVQEKYDDLSPAGTVLGTAPEVGQPIAPGAQITLIVSKGRAPITVPTVIGMQFGEAQGLLQSLGLKVTQEMVADTTKPQGEVLEQDPAGGSGVEKNATVKLKVSNNVNMVAMPRMIGAGCQDAKRQLEGAGYPVELHGNDIEKFVGKVSDQNPQPGQPIQPGQRVIFTCKV